MKITRLFLLMLCAVLLMKTPALAENEFGLVVETKGKPTIKRGNSAINAEFGMEIRIDDLIGTDKDDQIVIVCYKTCEEWTIPSLSKVKIISKAEMHSMAGQITLSNQLPVCYKPEKYSTNTNDNVIGGIVLRGERTKDDSEINRLFKRANAGKASNSELLGLIVYNVNQGDKTQARKYYSKLLQRYPNATIPQSLAEKLK